MSTFLRSRILGRVIRPYALTVSLATAVVTWAILTDRAVGKQLDYWPGHLIGVMGVITVLLLWGGWWSRNEGWMMHGLLLSTGVWAGVGTVLALEGAGIVSGLLAWCWVIASGGAWLLEVDEARRRGVR